MVSSLRPLATMSAGKYMVIFKPDTTVDQMNNFMTMEKAFTNLQSENKIDHTYNMQGFRGFAAELSHEQLATFESLKSDKTSIIDYIGKWMHQRPAAS
ncbi:hypothetical protein B0H12DRAFT_1104657, partial [Mycena haematopus]